MASPPSSPDPTVGPGGYPIFADGDVLITSGTGRSWKLHSTTLRTASKEFRALFAKNPARRLTKKQLNEGHTVKWKIEMIPFEDCPEDIRFRSFRVVPEKGKNSFQLLDHLNGIAADAPFPNVYDNFFRCLYHLEPEFIGEEDDEGAFYILDALSLLQAAEYADAVKAVRRIVELALLSLGNVLWDHIFRNSEAWADVAVRLESPSILRESLIHLIGRIDLRDSIRKRFLHEQMYGDIIFKLVRKKADELKQQKLIIERLLLDYYPPKMIHKETATEVPGRSIYATDIYLWQALSLCRSWISACYLANKHHRAVDGGVQFYKYIAIGGPAYLHQDALDKFHVFFPMSTKGKQCLNVAIDFVKDELKAIVAPLLINRLQFDRDNEDAEEWGYLTCGEILDEELPWVVAAAAEAGFLAEKAEKARVRKAAEVEAVETRRKQAEDDARSREAENAKNPDENGDDNMEGADVEDDNMEDDTMRDDNMEDDMEL